MRRPGAAPDVLLAPTVAADALATLARGLQASLPPRRGLPAPLAPADVRARPGLPQVEPGSRSVGETGGPGRATAAAALNDFIRAYYARGPLDTGFWRERCGSWRPASFWQTAELIELLEDACECHPDAGYGTLVDALCRGVLLRYGRVWTRRRAFNDDVIWMVLAFARACGITGRVDYLTAARHNLDLALARGWSSDLDGGLWWTTARHEKNACVNVPAAVAACLLVVALEAPGYLEWAQRLYAWTRKQLYDPPSGRVCDRLELADGDPLLVRDASTYNQGTFIGAADLLGRLTGDRAYAEDAAQALAFARRELTRDGVLRGEGEGSDGGGFKGIFARYAVRFVRHHGLADDEAWLQRNAQAAWRRHDARGLIPQEWTGPAPAAPPAPASRRGHGPAAWDASSAVVLLQLLAAGDAPATGRC